MYYTAETVTNPIDRRDRLTDRLQTLVDTAIDDDNARPKIGKLLFGQEPVGAPPGNWPPPSTASRERAHTQSRVAAEAARSQLRALGTRHLYTTLGELPRVPVTWEPLRPDQKIPPAPLAHSLVAADAMRHLLTLTTYAFASHRGGAFEGDVQRHLLRRLNAFAQLEISLWWFAADGGYPDPPPYVVRYDLARWLWHPSIHGAIFCLRCGEELHYKRRARTRAVSNDTPPEITRSARCPPCSRGPENDWPAHALEPYRRGTWLLRCSHPGCREVFVGRRQGRHCEQHRQNRLTPSMRRT